MNIFVEYIIITSVCSVCFVAGAWWGTACAQNRSNEEKNK